MKLTIDVTKILCNVDYLNDCTFTHAKDCFKLYCEYLIDCKDELKEYRINKINIHDNFKITILGDKLRNKEFYEALFQDIERIHICDDGSYVIIYETKK